MGNGSGASKAVAQIVLLDGRFADLPKVVAEGRRVLGNIERVAHLFLTKTIYACLMALAVGLAQVPFPFLPRHLTLVSALTIGVPAFFLALAPNAARARPGFVSRVLRFTIPAGSIAAASSLAAYGFALASLETTLEQDGTTAVITLAVVSLWVLATVMRPLTAWRVVLLVAMVAGFLAAFVIQPAREFLALDPGGWTSEMPLAGACALAGVLLLELASRLFAPSVNEGSTGPDPAVQDVDRSGTAAPCRGARRGGALGGSRHGADELDREEPDMTEATQTWRAVVHIFDHGDSTTADAALTTHAGNTLHGRGRARRNPADPDVPEIGEEVAVARALRDLADKVLATASEDISEIEHHEVHLRR